MAIEITCDECENDLRSNDEVLCVKCAKSSCTECKEVAEKLYCAVCAETEFGDDGDDIDDGPSIVVDAALIEDLASAIRRGDREDAELILDRIASEVEDWPEHVSRGRFSPRARKRA
jgi:hypothetical protein